MPGACSEDRGGAVQPAGAEPPGSSRGNLGSLRRARSAVTAEVRVVSAGASSSQPAVSRSGVAHPCFCPTREVYSKGFSDPLEAQRTRWRSAASGSPRARSRRPRPTPRRRQQRARSAREGGGRRRPRRRGRGRRRCPQLPRGRARRASHRGSMCGAGREAPARAAREGRRGSLRIARPPRPAGPRGRRERSRSAAAQAAPMGEPRCAARRRGRAGVRGRRPEERCGGTGGAGRLPRPEQHLPGRGGLA